MRTNASRGIKAVACGVLTAWLLPSCTEESAGGDGKEPVEAKPDAGPESDGPLGGFTVSLLEATPSKGATTNVSGKLYDGPTPESLIWTVTSEAGDCQLLEPRVPFCDPPCGGTSICVEDGVCAPYPRGRSAGEVTVSGLGAGPFTMKPISGSYQMPGGTTLPYPPAAEGSPFKLEAEGDQLPSFVLEGRAIRPLSLSGSLAIVLGEPLSLTWTPPASPGLEQIYVKLDISHHGGTKGKILCETADEGTLEIPASLVSDLVALGVAGFPTILVSRSAISTAKIRPGVVALTVVSAVEREIAVPGVTSCTATDQCPPGQLCGSDLRCQ